jgi:hypothetical protein
MSSYNDTDEDFLSENTDDDGQNTMAVLNTLGGGGGDDVLAEGEPLGLDPDSGKAKLSGSTLAVGVVVVLGAVTLLGMKLTLGAMGVGAGPAEAMAEIDSFIAKQHAAQQTGHDGPLKAPDQESNDVLEELKQDPTDHQVPPEEVKTNPFDFSDLFPRRDIDDGTGKPAPKQDSREIALAKAQTAAGKIRVDGISGKIVFLDGKDYRVGDTIDGGQFEIAEIDGLSCIIRTTDEHGIALRLRYR